MLVFSPWLKPAVNRSFQAAEAWDGAARAIRTAAQTAASAAVVRGTYPAPSFSIGARCRTAPPPSRPEGADLPSPYGGLTKVLRAPPSVRVEARGRRRAVAQHHRVELLEHAVVGRVSDQVVDLPRVGARVVELLRPVAVLGVEEMLPADAAVARIGGRRVLVPALEQEAAAPAHAPVVRVQERQEAEPLRAGMAHVCEVGPARRPVGVQDEVVVDARRARPRVVA